MIQFEKDRCTILRKADKKGKFISYWMTSNQRIENNFSLRFAARIAKEKKLPLKIFFIYNKIQYDCISRHLKFMFEGLKDVLLKFNNFNHKINFYEYGTNLCSLILSDCDTLVLDEPYTERSRKYLKSELKDIDCNIYSIDNLYLPTKLVSNKEEYSAATFRRKYYKLVDDLIDQTFKIENELNGITTLDDPNEYTIDIFKILSDLPKDKYLINQDIQGGHDNAVNTFKNYIDNDIFNYDEKSNNPENIKNSCMSKYLHYGHISIFEIIYDLMKINFNFTNSFVEQILIRRELAYNYTYHNKNYNNHKGLPNWAIESLISHQEDKREFVYDLHDFEFAKTHDLYWNSAQIQLLKYGYIHGYMRMYWGKKILEWTKNFQEGIKIALYLNNKYQLDGRNPNSYVGILWCFGLHDRGWKERSIFGKIRYMNENGLKRKFDIDRYVNNFSNSNQIEIF